MLPKIRAGRARLQAESEPRRKVGEASRFALFGTKQTETVRLRRTASRPTARTEPRPTALDSFYFSFDRRETVTLL